MMADLPSLPELRFAKIPATSRHRYVGDRFCYMEAGRVDLPPVLLLHGIGANSLHWRFQLAGLADRFWLIAWNAPGYLLSDNLRAETPSCRDYADALDDLLSALGIGRFDVVAKLVRHAHHAVLCLSPARADRAGGVHRYQHPSKPVDRGARAECPGAGAHDRTRRLWFRGTGSGIARVGGHNRYFGSGAASPAGDQPRRFHAGRALYR